MGLERLPGLDGNSFNPLGGNAYGYGGAPALLSGYAQGLGNPAGINPYMTHAQQMCRGGNPHLAGQQMFIMQLVQALLQHAMAQLMCGGGAGGWNPQQLEGQEKDGWLAQHGGYERNGEGQYKINSGAYEGCTARHLGEGRFAVISPDGCVMGCYQSPTKTDKIASPLTYDLNGDGKVSTTDIKGGRKFDLNGDGKVDQTAWAGKGDGVLTFDGNGDGVSGADGRELLGDNTDVDGDGKADGHKNGFDALRALALKHLGPAAVADGKLGPDEIKLLEAKAGLRMQVDGVSKKPSELGITQLDLGYREAGRNADANGNEHRQLGSFTINGEQRKANDVWFRYQ